MKFGVNKKVLLYTAGCVWIFAGINILRIGIITWLNDTHYWLFKIGEATIVFLLFFNLVFKRNTQLGIIFNSQFSIFNSQVFRRSTQQPSCRSSACRQRSVPYGSYRLRR